MSQTVAIKRVHEFLRLTTVWQARGAQSGWQHQSGARSHGSGDAISIGASVRSATVIRINGELRRAPAFSDPDWRLLPIVHKGHGALPRGTS